MVGKVLKVEGPAATVRLSRNGEGCLSCTRDCATAKGEPTVTVRAPANLREGQVVRLADRRWTFWWIKAGLFLAAFILTAGLWASAAGLVGLREGQDKLTLALSLIAGGLAWYAAGRRLAGRPFYVVKEILETTHAGTQN